LTYQFKLGVGSRKKTVQEKSQKGYISLVWGEGPTEAIYIKNCVVGDVLT